MQIVPNLHPIFVHFSVALLPLAAAFFVLSRVVTGPPRDRYLTVAWWMLWLGVGLSLLTVGSGIYAYNTVNHDTPSHLAMTDHRNWALATLVLYLALAAWSYQEYRRDSGPSVAFVVAVVLAVLVLGSTAWRGGELVYRHGLGVMSLPKATGDGHDHDHGDGQGHDESAVAPAAGQHDNNDGHHDPKPHDNADGHHDPKPHDNADGHHDPKPHDNTDGHHDQTPLTN